MWPSAYQPQRQPKTGVTSAWSASARPDQSEPRSGAVATRTGLVRRLVKTLLLASVLVVLYAIAAYFTLELIALVIV